MNKPTLVLLPGMLCDEMLWQHQASHLADIAEIQIGDLTQPDSIKGMARAILAKSPPQFALAGLSLGGIVAFEIMRQPPQRVTHLALLDTTPYSMSPERVRLWEPLTKVTQRKAFASLATGHLKTMMYSKHREDPVLLDVLQRMAEHVSPTGFQNQLQAQIKRSDSCETLSQITCSTLVLVGQEDFTCPLDLHLDMVNILPNATFAVIEHCGHLSCLEQPEAVTMIMRTWLEMGSQH